MVEGFNITDDKPTWKNSCDEILKESDFYDLEKSEELINYISEKYRLFMVAPIGICRNKALRAECRKANVETMEEIYKILDSSICPENIVPYFIGVYKKFDGLDGRFAFVFRYGQLNET